MTAATAAVRRISTRRAWAVLAVGVLAQTATTVLVSAPALLIPVLSIDRHLPLPQAGLLAAAPNLGLVLTLVAWGAAADRFGERVVLVVGLLLSTACALLAAVPAGPVGFGVALLAAGAASGCANAASGRVVVGWFPRERRGLAMGIRQMCQPLGVTIAALTVPGIGAAAGPGAALLLPAALCAASAVLVALVVVDPPRATRTAAATANPYRRDAFLLRVHLVSALLVVPQFTLSTFGLVWLVGALRVPALTAGLVVGVAQFTGAFGRLAVGALSDRARSRVGPLRLVALVALVLMVALAAVSATGPTAVAVVAYVLAATISVADNGLAFTAVAEAAGGFWAGRALGVQNTGQFLAAAAVGPVVGALVALVGFPLAFLVVATTPAAALPLVPRRSGERDHL
ncbi:MFS transporter [Amnibacterium sp. CER49]|uniref:MFS transporter n=1 Tax=Amnibacterium sp. CER49 TaxID=3039161 RepID=UPI002447E94A|nr:MFS transporter [Amnibacterium sp. CER49]MDH2443725.1 MFS transporter [Amnibacterium sp. CER49]